MTSLRVAENITELVGETPILHLPRMSPPGGAQVFAKLENLNPGGSVKDRAAIGMIQRAESEGRLKPGSTIVEATAGNTGIGLALIGVNKGYRVLLVVPEKFAEEKVKIMRALGAEVVRTPDEQGMQGAIEKVKELAAAIPGSFTALQFENPANPDYHHETTAREIYEQMKGQLDAVVVGVGTGGTFTGVARFMKERRPAVRCVAVETEGSILGGGPPGPHKVEGIGSSFIPKTFDAKVCDEIIMVTDKDAFDTVAELGRQEGILGGLGVGAHMFWRMYRLKKAGKGKRVVTIIPDAAERYLSKNIFEGGA